MSYTPPRTLLYTRADSFRFRILPIIFYATVTAPLTDTRPNPIRPKQPYLTEPNHIEPHHTTPKPHPELNTHTISPPKLCDSDTYNYASSHTTVTLKNPMIPTHLR